MLALALSVLSASDRVLVVWTPGKGDRGLYALTRALGAGQLPPLRLAPGFPRLVPESEAVALGVCSRAEGRRLAWLVDGAETQALPDAGASWRGCPSLPTENGSFFELLGAGADAAMKLRAARPVCERQLSGEALCEALWGVTCAAAERIIARAREPGCGFLTTRPTARRSMRVELDGWVLEACGDGAAAWFFAHGADGRTRLVDVLCDAGGERSVGEIEPVAGGVCLEHGVPGARRRRCWLRDNGEVRVTETARP